MKFDFDNWKKRGKYLVLGSVFVLPFVLFHWALPFVGERILGNDYGVFSQPQQMELMFSLEHGSWPLYAHGYAGGRAAAALTQGQLLHPISHIASELPFYWQGNGSDLSTLLRLFSLGLAHFALLMLLRRLKLPLDLAYAISLLTVYNMRMLDIFRFASALENYTAHLLLLAAIAFYYLKPSKVVWPAAIAGSTYLLVVGGHPQFMYFGFLVCGIALLAIPFVLPEIEGSARRDLRSILKYYGSTSVFIVTGVIAASAYTLPLYFDFISELSVRTDAGYEWSLRNQDSWGGELNSFFSPLNVSVEGSFGSSAMICLLLTVPLLALARAQVSRVVLILFGAVVLVFLLSIGDATPIHYLYWKYFPMAGTFRVPGRITTMMPALIFLILAWFWGRADQPLLVWGRRLPLSRVSAAGAISLLLLVLHFLWLEDLIPAAQWMGGFSTLPLRFRRVPPFVQPVVFGFAAATLLLTVIRGLSTRWQPIVGTLLVLTMLFQVGIEMNYGTWVAKRTRTKTKTMEEYERRKSRSLNYVGNPGVGSHSDITGKRMNSSFYDVRLAVFYREWQSVTDAQEALDRMATTQWANTTFIEQLEPERRPADHPPDAATKPDVITLAHSSYNRLVFEVSNSADGFFNLTALDTDNRWRAEVDSQPARIYPANGGEQAVFLKAGSHQVDFRYVSVASNVGFALSLGIAALLGIYFSLIGLSGRTKRNMRWCFIAASTLVPTLLFYLWYGSLYSGDNLGLVYKWSSAQRIPSDNLAFGKRTELSADAVPWRTPYHTYSGLGVDGHRRHRGFKTHRNRKRPWWRVDLGADHRLGEIVIFDGRKRTGKQTLPLVVTAARDGKKYRRLRVIDERGDAYPWRIPLEGQQARYVQLNAPKSRHMAFVEVEIYPYKPPPPPR